MENKKELTREDLSYLFAGLDLLRHEYFEVYLDCKKNDDKEGAKEYWSYIKDLEKVRDKLEDKTINIDSLFCKYGL